MLKSCANVIIRTVNVPTSRAYSVVASKEKWDILTAVCLERKPLVIPEMTDLQKKFQDQLQQIELKRSYKSEHEVQHEQDLKHLELLKKGEIDVDVDVTVKQTAQDFLDSSVDDLAKFKFAPKRTAADEKNDANALNRQLDKHLVLLTQEKIAGDKFYILPQGIRNDGETLRQTAERVLKDKVGDEIKAQIYGNAPVGFYKYKYPQKVREGSSSVGAKVFIYFARYKSGDVDQKVSHKWLDRQSLRKELPEKYHKSLELFLIDE